MKIEEKRRMRKERRSKIEELKKYHTITFWNNRLSESSEGIRMQHFLRFMEYLRAGNSKFKDYTPDQLVEYQRDATSHGRYEILDQLQGWVNTLERAKHPDGEPIYRSATMDQMYSLCRSFFVHNRCDLPRDSGFTISGDVPPTEGTLTTEEIKEIILHIKPVYRAVFLSIFQSGMDQQSFIYWNENGYEKLVEALKKDPKTIRIRFPRRLKIRRKVEKPFHTYIGTDAIDAIRKWLEIRPDEATVIFTNQIKTPVGKYALDGQWRETSFKLGIIKRKRIAHSGNRYGKNIHEMRDVFRSIWEKTPAKSVVAEFMLGHQIDPLEYNKACRDMDWTESEYLKALPWLNIMSGGAEMKAVEDELIEKDTRIEELEAEITRLKETSTDKEGMMEEIYDKIMKQISEKKG